MPALTVRTRLTHAAALAALRRLPAALAGRGGAPAEARAALEAVGLAFLGKAHPAFVVKARGGTDECGLRWAALSPYTIKERVAGRRHPKSVADVNRDDRLIDTGYLVDSLAPDRPRPHYQVFRFRKGGLTLGTSRPFARQQHEGRPPLLPRRRLWAAPADWHRDWWAAMLGALREGAVEVAKKLLGAS